MTERFDITLTINGRDYPIRVEPRKTLEIGRAHV